MPIIRVGEESFYQDQGALANGYVDTTARPDRYIVAFHALHVYDSTQEMNAAQRRYDRMNGSLLGGG